MGLVVIFFVVSLGKRAGRGALKLLKRPARFSRGFVAERRVRSDVVVVVSPERQFAAGVIQTVEHLFVQTFVPEAAVE